MDEEGELTRILAELLLVIDSHYDTQITRIGSDIINSQI